MHLPPPPEPYGGDIDFHINSMSMQPTTTTMTGANDLLADVFGSDSGHPSHEPIGLGLRNHDMTLDTRRLQSQHTTTGYREGITAGKATSIQAGFDQGFQLGANVGLRAGELLGLLEAIAAALAETGSSPAIKHADRLLSEASADLKPDSIFTSEFWEPDGTWKFPVRASRQDGELIYQDVADSHPLILKWHRKVSDEVIKWGIDITLPVLDKEAEIQDNIAQVPSARTLDASPAARNAIDW
ncbi:hypothetical protein GGR57DRAFT_505727 [Xylariaceae sp. FL1272]|nr:hypothetical protein GGR57DRAFT_505727 [Xylariaceae sp. FL1272]